MTEMTYVHVFTTESPDDLADAASAVLGAVASVRLSGEPGCWRITVVGDEAVVDKFERWYFPNEYEVY